MQNYLLLLRHLTEIASISDNHRVDRTGVGTVSLFGASLFFDVENSFPLMTTKKLHWPSIVHELLWFISGSTNIKYLKDNGVSIWNEWADANGELGPVYGSQWRHWQSGDVVVDQLKVLIDGLKNNPTSRRHIVSAWNVGKLHKMALPPCHCFAQWYVDNGKGLHCQLYMRSVDTFLGMPFNIASYALLNLLIAHCTGLTSKSLNIVFGDTHLYLNHIEQANQQLSRVPTALPTVSLADNTPTDIDQIKFEHIVLNDYTAQASIKAPIAV